MNTFVGYQFCLIFGAEPETTTELRVPKLLRQKLWRFPKTALKPWCVGRVLRTTCELFVQSHKAESWRRMDGLLDKVSH